MNRAKSGRGGEGRAEIINAISTPPESPGKGTWCGATRQCARRARGKDMRRTTCLSLSGGKRHRVNGMEDSGKTFLWTNELQTLQAEKQMQDSFQMAGISFHRLFTWYKRDF